jgi:SAM-dependent methyltransferase
MAPSRLFKGFVRTVLSRAGYEIRRAGAAARPAAEEAGPELAQLRQLVAAREAELEQLRRAAEARQKELAQSQHVIEALTRRHYPAVPLPPEELRLHVGMNTTAANFQAQGINSSGRVLEVFGERPDGPVLDWGCGSGRTWRWLAAHPGWREHYRGCDVDREAIEWLGGAGEVRPRVEVCGDLPPLPYRDGELAGAFAFSVLTHIHPDRHRVWYEELRRVLRPGGRAYLTTQGRPVLPLLPEEARQELTARGWCYVRHEGHYKDAAVVTEAFTRQAVRGLFTVESYREEGYQNMDAFLLRREG